MLAQAPDGLEQLFELFALKAETNLTSQGLDADHSGATKSPFDPVNHQLKHRPPPAPVRVST
jgi:hypothetical protein